MRKATTMFTGFAIVAILLIASPGFARMCGGQHDGSGKMGGRQCRTANLTDAQQAEAKAIEDTYADQFTEKDNVIKAKAEEMNLLMTNDQTTVAQINQLRAEMFLAKQDYRKLRISVNEEITTKLGAVYCNCSKGNCQSPGQCRMANNNQSSPDNMKHGKGGCCKGRGGRANR